MKVKVNEVKNSDNNGFCNFPFLAKSLKYGNVYLVLGGSVNNCRVMCLKVVDGHHWNEMEVRNNANGKNLVKLNPGSSVKFTQ